MCFYTGVIYILSLASCSALNYLDVSMSSAFASPPPNTTEAASEWDVNFESLVAMQRLRDNLLQAREPLALGGWTAELVPRSTEYEKRSEESDDDDDAEAEATVGSADVELSDRQQRALPYRLVREVKRRKTTDHPLKRWAKLVCDFPSYRGSLAGPMPKRVGAAEAEAEGWFGVGEDDMGAVPASSYMDPLYTARSAASSESLWVAGAEIELRDGAPYDVVREAFKAAEAHFARVRELRSQRVDVSAGGSSAGGSSAGGSAGGSPRRLGAEALKGLEDGGHLFEAYNTATDAEVAGDDDLAAATPSDELVEAVFFVDVTQKGHVGLFLEALARFADIDDDAHCPTPTVVKAYLGGSGAAPSALRWLLTAAAAAAAPQEKSEGGATALALVGRKFLEALRSGDKPPAALKKAMAKLRPKPEVPPDLFATTNDATRSVEAAAAAAAALESLGLHDHPMPFLLVDGRLVDLAGESAESASSASVSAVQMSAAERQSGIENP